MVILHILIDSVLAAADLQQKRFVGFDGNCCTAGAKALGVVDVTTEKGQYAPVAVLGTLLVEAGGTIAVGDAIASDGEGIIDRLFSKERMLEY